MDTSDTQPVPTPSQLHDELSGFFMRRTRIRQLDDGTFEICLPLMTTPRWRPAIFAKPNRTGSFEVFACNGCGGKFFFPILDADERGIKFFFGSAGVEATSDHGDTIFCSRDNLPKVILCFGFYLQCLYFARAGAITEEAAFPKR